MKGDFFRKCFFPCLGLLSILNLVYGVCLMLGVEFSHGVRLAIAVGQIVLGTLGILGSVTILKDRKNKK